MLCRLHLYRRARIRGQPISRYDWFYLVCSDYNVHCWLRRLCSCVATWKIFRNLLCDSWIAWYGQGLFLSTQWIFDSDSLSPQKAFSLPIIVFEFNYLYNLDKDECKLRPEELTNEPTKEKSKRIDHFHKSLTQSLRRNKASLNMMSTDVRDDCSKSSNMADLWNYAKRKNQFRRSVSFISLLDNFISILANNNSCSNSSAIQKKSIESIIYQHPPKTVNTEKNALQKYLQVSVWNS